MLDLYNGGAFVPIKTVNLLLSALISISALSQAIAADEDSMVYDIIIVGGGIAGLTAAFYLDDYDFLLLEKEKQVGGRATSGQYQGIPYAKGPEYLGKPETPLKEIIAALNLTLREIPPPVDVVSYKGKMFSGDYGKARLLVKKSSLGEFNRFVTTILQAYEEYEEIPDLALKGSLGRLDNITARQWFEEEKFSPIYSEIYNVAFRGLFGANIDEISALSALPEMAYDFEGFESIDDSGDLADEFSDSGNSTGVYTFDEGIAEIPLALEAHLGDRLRVGTTVTQLKKAGELFEISCRQADNKRITYRADSVIVATPSAITLDIAGSILSDEQRQLLGSVSYSPYATIALFSEKPIFNKGFDLAVPDGLMFTDIYDATWVTRHYNKSSKAKQKWITLIYAAPTSYRDNAFPAMSDQKLVSTVFTQLDRLIPAASKLVKGHEITRFQYGYPVMTPGSYRRMTRLQEITNDGLYLAGDYIIYPTFEAAASSGLLAARKTMEWLED